MNRNVPIFRTALALACLFLSGVRSPAQTFPGFSPLSGDVLIHALDPSLGGFWADFDRDGDADLFVCNDLNMHNRLYRNNGSGSFTDITPAFMIADSGYFYGAAWGDYDNDGYPDLFVAQDGDNNRLYHNTGQGTFEPVTPGEITYDRGQSWSADWADIDNDGFLDLFVANHFQINFLYRNNGDGTFRRIDDDPVVADSGATVSGHFCDFDNDGDPDLYIARNEGMGDLLFQNDGSGSFLPVTGTPVTDAPGPGESAESWGGSWGDFDNDGWFDLYVARGDAPGVLFRNTGMTFERATSGHLASSSIRSRSSAWQDADNNGWPDLAVSNKASNSILYLNAGGTDFNLYPLPLANSWGLSWTDADRDGRSDLFITGYDESNMLYVAASGPEHWIRIQCYGHPSNVLSVGARVFVRTTRDGSPFRQYRIVGGLSGYGGQSVPEAAFGLGSAEHVDSLVIRWPSGVTGVWTGLAADSHYVFSETEPAGLLPGAVNDTAVLAPGDSLTLDPLANDRHVAENRAVIAGVDTARLHGRIRLLPHSSRLVYISPSGFTGRDTLAYRLQALWGYADTALAVFHVTDETGLNTPSASLPEALELHPNQPNPFNPATVIRYTLSEASQMRLEVFGLQGRSIAVLRQGFQPAGTHTVQWHGTDSRGVPVSSGVYVIRLTAGRHVRTGKMLLMR